jgi:hypothetical protein
MDDKVYYYCIKGLQHLYQQITILDQRGYDTDDFVEIYEAIYIILKSKININRKDINNIDIQDTGDLYYHSIQASVLLLVFSREGVIKFGKKEILPFRAIYNMFLNTVKKYTGKTTLQILEGLAYYDDKLEKEPADFYNEMKNNVNIDTD